jgi:hypothetical protein
MGSISADGLYNLEDLALELGATVEYDDGRKFNTAQMRGKRPVKPRTEMAPPPMASVAPVAPKNDETVEMLKQVISLLNRPVEVRMPDMPAPQVTVTASAPVAQPVRWAFEFDRNPNGTIKRINATPQQE